MDGEENQRKVREHIDDTHATPKRGLVRGVSMDSGDL